jgi:hypothetical protein
VSTLLGGIKMKETLMYGYGANIKGLELDFIKITDETKYTIENSAGIYLAYNSNDEVIYVGESKTLNKRVPVHFGIGGKFHEELAYMMVAYVEADRYERHIIEGILFQKYQPKHNSNDDSLKFKNKLSAELLHDIYYYVNVKGYPIGRVADGLKVSSGTVSKYANSELVLPENYKPVRYVRDSVRNKYTKITRQSFNEIREIIEKEYKVTNLEIAKRFNTYDSMISQIRNLKTPQFQAWEELRKRATA